MTRKITLFAAGMAVAFVPGIGLAQAVPDPASPQAPPANQAAPADQSPPPNQAEGETQVSITPADVDNFAVASMAISKIQAEPALDDAQKQEKMVAAVNAAGIDPIKFNAIAKASETNPQLREQVQLAMQKQQAIGAGQ